MEGPLDGVCAQTRRELMADPQLVVGGEERAGWVAAGVVSDCRQTVLPVCAEVTFCSKNLSSSLYNNLDLINFLSIQCENMEDLCLLLRV